MKHEADLSCSTGKRRYSDFGTAAKLAKRVRQQRDGEKVQPFHCVLCHGFHLGNSNGRRLDDRRKVVPQ